MTSVAVGGATCEIVDLVTAPVTLPAAGFAKYTFPRYRRWLDTADERVTAIGATIAGIPVGLVLGWVAGDDAAEGGIKAQLLSLSVCGPFRRRRIGSALLSRLEASLAARGLTELFTRYSGRIVARAAFERTIAAAGWQTPQFEVLRLTAECGRMIAAVSAWPAIRGRLLHATRYDFTPWGEISNDDRVAIDHLCEQPACLRWPMLQPRHWDKVADPAISIAVRRDGGLVGWVLAERLPALPDRPTRAVAHIHYAAAYLEEALWRSGIMAAAYVHAFRRQAAAYGDDSIARYSTPIPAMIALTRRRYAPIAIETEDFYFSAKRLPPDDANSRHAAQRRSGKASARYP